MRMRGLGMVLLALMCVRATWSAGASAFPSNQWQTVSPEAVGMDPAKLAQARDYALTGQGSGIIVRHGKVVLTWGDLKARYDLKSTTKSFGAAAFGLALLDGKLRLEDRAAKFHPALGVPPETNRATGWLEEITMLQLLTQTAGFEKPGGFTPLLFKAGTQWDYSDSGPNWLAECITLAYQKDLDALMFERVFTPIGIGREDLVWRKNQYRPEFIEGVKRREFGAGIHANVDALARFGYLHLRKGEWNGQRLLPADYIELVSKPHPIAVGLPVRNTKDYGNASNHYGLLWWNNADGMLADVPRNAYWSWGLYDSLTVVIPSLDIVVARAGKSWKREPNSEHYDVLKPFLGPICASTRSPVIENIVWAPRETIIRKARGGDNWPLTWGDDDVLYTAYGDARGFEPFIPEKYHSASKRYLWCQILPGKDPRFAGGFAVRDAPDPWGPWTTAFYTENWDVGPGETSSFPAKWMEPNGTNLYLVFSGDDFFSVRRASMVLRTAKLRLDVMDAETEKPLPCRVYIQGSNGAWHFAKSAGAIEHRKQKDWNPASVEMHTTHPAGPISASLAPGIYSILVERGKEYLPESRQVKIESEDVQTKIPLRRWINMAELGWYSGDTHVHRPINELRQLVLAEDLNVAFPLTSWVTDAFVSPTKGRTNADQQTRAELIRVDKTHVIYPRNTEYEIFRVGQKNHTLGAFFVLGHKTLFDVGVPPVGPVGKQAHAEGALIELDKHNWPWSMMLVPILRVDLYELANNHLWRTEFGYRDYGDPAPDYMRIERDEKGWTERGWVDYGFQNYYALLNCGFRLRPTAGTASGVHPVPLGFGRVYVHLPEGFSYEGWLRGLNEGRSFVTTGPMLLVQMNGKRLTGRAIGAVPLKPLEIVVNGEVVRTVAARNRETPQKGFESAFDEELTIDESAWVAVRCFEDRPDGRVRFAHTAPFFIDVPGKPLRPRRVEIEFLISRIEGELARHAQVLPEPALEEYREALRIYQKIARDAR